MLKLSLKNQKKKEKRKKEGLVSVTLIWKLHQPGTKCIENICDLIFLVEHNCINTFYVQRVLIFVT